MPLFFRSPTFILMIVLATLGLHATYTSASPLGSKPATLVARDSLSEHGSSCTAWTEEQPDGYYKMKMSCTKVGRGLQVCGSVRYSNYVFRSLQCVDNNLLGAVVSTSSYNSNRELDQLAFQYSFSASGNPDMGSCTSNLVEVEHAIKNGWYNTMTCSDISPYLKVRAVLSLPGAFDQYSEWITSPGTVQTLERESWFGQPSAYAEWTPKS